MHSTRPTASSTERDPRCSMAAAEPVEMEEAVETDCVALKSTQVRKNHRIRRRPVAVSLGP